MSNNMKKACNSIYNYGIKNSFKKFLPAYNMRKYKSFCFKKLFLLIKYVEFLLLEPFFLNITTILESFLKIPLAKLYEFDALKLFAQTLPAPGSSKSGLDFEHSSFGSFLDKSCGMKYDLITAYSIAQNAN